MGAQADEDLSRRNIGPRIGQGFIHRPAQPAGHRGVLTIEGAQAGANDFAGRGVGTGFHPPGHLAVQIAEGDGDGAVAARHRGLGFVVTLS